MKNIKKSSVTLLAVIALLHCSSHNRDNPFDTEGNAWAPPVVVAMADTTVAINDSFYVHAVGTDPNGTVKKYLWALDGTNYRDSTESGRVGVAYLTAGTKTVMVKVRDVDGVQSLVDTVKVTVNLYPPMVVAMADTAVAINDSFYVHAVGTDSNGTVKKYLWALDGVNYRDSTDSGRVRVAYFTAGTKNVLVKVMDDDGVKSVVDTVKALVKDNQPINLSPFNGDTLFTVRPTLRWIPGLYASSFTVRFDTVNPPVAVAATGITDSLYTSATALVNYKTYYWQVAGKNASGQESLGAVWQFIPGKWNALGSGMNGAVADFAFDATGNLYAGGYFTTAGGTTANFIAKWNGSTWSALGSVINSAVNALAFDTSGNLYAGGRFTTAGGTMANFIAKWNGNTWSALGSGMDNDVHALAFDATGNLYACGYFTMAGGTKANNIAKWNGSTWGALGSGIDVCSLAFDTSGNLYAGGSFTTAGGTIANNIAKWNGSTWSALGSGMNGFVNDFAFDATGNLYACGSFTTAGGTAANCIAKWNGITWSALGSGMDNNVVALAFDATGNLYAGGRFTTAGGTAANNIAKWNGITWSALGSGMDNDVNALAFDTTGNLYACGSFTTAGGTKANNIAVLRTR